MSQKTPKELAEAAAVSRAPATESALPPAQAKISDGTVAARGGQDAAV